MSFSVSEADFQLLGQRFQVDLAAFSARAGELLLVGQIGRLQAQLLQDPRGHLVAFRMDPGGVQRVVAVGNLQEAGGLHEGRLADAGHLLELLRGS